MGAVIVNNRIDGTRVTVWNVLHYLENGWSEEETANALGLSAEQVRAAVAYIDEHRLEVMAVHRQIEERNERGNPPDVEARLARTRARMNAWLKDRQPGSRQETNGAGNPDGR